MKRDRIRGRIFPAGQAAKKCEVCEHMYTSFFYNVDVKKRNAKETQIS